MKKIIFIFFIISTLNTALGQNQNSIWCFGDSAGIDFSNIANPVSFFSGMDGRGSCSSIADTSGNLLFYCFSTLSSIDSATLVYNFLNDSMDNGSNLVGPSYYNNIIIVPIPNDPNKYYIFHLGFYNPTIGLFYSVVDMTANGGVGAVIQKNILLSNNMHGDCLQAVKHGNGRDWWLLTKLGNNGATQIDRFYIYRITPGNNINSPIVQDFGNAVDAVNQKIILNNKADKLMNINVGGFMFEYNFDRCTGIISNPHAIFPQQLSNFTRIFDEGVYSPNDTLFYVSRNSYGGSFGNKNYLLQYDLTAGNIPLSCDTLDSTLYPPVDNGALRLAPDGKIYYSQAYISSSAISVPYADTMRNYINQNLGVINNPNVLGNGCNFQPFSFNLGGKRTYYSLPNNPNYELGNLAGSPCDTLGVGIEKLEINNNAELFIFYYSSWKKLFINAKNIKGNNCMLQIFDITGKKVFSSSQKSRSTYFTQDVDLSNLKSGMYLVSLITENEKLFQKFIKD
jgi:hypothetical protein